MKNSYYFFLAIIVLSSCDKKIDSLKPGEQEKPTQATFEILESLGSTYHISSVSAMSADGGIIVGQNRGVRHEDSRAVKWVNGEITALSLLTNENVNLQYAEASGISPDGSLIIGTGAEANKPHTPLLWKNGTAYTFQVPEEGTQGNSASVRDVTNDGDIIVGHVFSYSYESDPGADHAYYWSPEPHRLDFGKINAITNDGTVMVGIRRDSNNEGKAFLWKNGNLIELNPTSELVPFEAYTVNSDGSVIAGTGYKPNDQNRFEAFLWINGSLISLGVIPSLQEGPGNPSAQALATSEDGSVVVGTSSNNSKKHAFIWTENEGMKNLQDILVNEYDINLEGLTLSTATCISADGRTIAGNALRDGEFEPIAWRVVFSN